MAEGRTATKSPSPTQPLEAEHHSATGAASHPQSPETARRSTSPATDQSFQPAIEAEGYEQEDEGDGYETASTASSRGTSSLSSSVRDYNFENKRRYHKFKEGRYAFPNDDAEQEREDMKHAMVVTICGGALHSAPLKNPHKILDIGTGTGIWAIDMGDEYPEAKITGVDLSPIQPAYVPANVSFIVDDAEAEWLYPENSFDYIHLRHMGPAIKNWTKLFAQAYRTLKPGGWVEIQEIQWDYQCDDGTMPPGYAVKKMSQLLWQGLSNLGITQSPTNAIPQHLKDAGFLYEIHDIHKVPFGAWPKRQDLAKIGSYCKAVTYDGLYGITVGPLTRGLDWTAEEVEIFLIDVRKDLLNTSIHSYVFYHSIAGQKPMDAEGSG
ncbi:S-adenosyl-L-methionine-dependent methyltransferase [Colletotrichum somersetense]|nr:S-adenosyl-L-methionine-dependent methyltransferase [Colletotrichum somersetense]